MNKKVMLENILPVSSSINKDGVLEIGGCNIRELAKKFGTPLYIYDEQTIRQMCTEYIQYFTQQIPSSSIFYAAKAWLNLSLVKILTEENIGMDAVSAGEIYIALKAGMNPKKITFHGNGKTKEELIYAIDNKIGKIVVDNEDELSTINEIANEKNVVQTIMLRISPNVDALTHKKTTTGTHGSKFGFPIIQNQAETALIKAMKMKNIDVSGFHTHLGSPIFNLDVYSKGIKVMGEFSFQMKEKHNYVWRDFSPGGGMAITYTEDKIAPTTKEYADKITKEIKNICKKHNLPIPNVMLEPGRSIVGKAGVALYSITSHKDIPNEVNYINIDGGMADNIRPAMYDAKYEVIPAEKMNAKTEKTVTIAGKYCESGDIVAKDIKMPKLEIEDLLAIPASGAYNLAMESNYNKALNPQVIMVNEGKSKIIRRRQKYEDLIALDS